MSCVLRLNASEPTSCDTLHGSKEVHQKAAPTWMDAALLSWLKMNASSGDMVSSSVAVLRAVYGVMMRHDEVNVRSQDALCSYV